jgi:FAM192A/Fyv6, N-terminal domain
LPAMSLSFVSKSIQTTTEDGSFVEKPVEGSADDGGGAGGASSSGDNRPLFEQLRQNQEQRDAEEEEYQRSMMRGTLALDEEDEAHLAGLRRQREREEMELRQQTDQELAAFRAARLDRFSTSAAAATNPRLDGEAEGIAVNPLQVDRNTDSVATASLLPTTKSVTTTAPTVAAKPSLPVFIRRRKRGSSEVDAKPGASTGVSEAAVVDQKKPRSSDESEDCTGNPEGLESKADNSTELPNAKLSSDAGEGIGGLLAGYDSSSEEES